MTDIVLVNLKQTKAKGEDMSQLQEYVDSQVTISPFKVKSQTLDKPKPKEITTTQPPKKQLQSRKLITSHRTEVKLLGWRSRNFDSVKSRFIDAEKDVLAPAEEALENISQKIPSLQEEQERLAKEAYALGYLRPSSLTQITTQPEACDERA